MILPHRTCIAAAIVFCTTTCDSIPDVLPTTIRCETDGGVTDVIRLDPRTGEAVLLSVSPVRHGTVEVTVNEYEVLFEKTESTYALSIRINRFTGEGRRESGNAPFGLFPLDDRNVFFQTACENYDKDDRL